MNQLTNTSTGTLKILAALFWYSGGVVLLIKGYRLLAEAETIHPGLYWKWVALVSGGLIGSLKMKLIFIRSCRRNLERINNLREPKVWQFFRPGFFVFLILMIALGATLSRQAHSNYPFLLGVAALDLSIAVALLGSSIVFWKQRN